MQATGLTQPMIILVTSVSIKHLKEHYHYPGNPSQFTLSLKVTYHQG